MKYLTLLLLCGGGVFASKAMNSSVLPAAGSSLQTFTEQPEFPHQLLNAFRAGALTEEMVDYFIRNSQQRHRAAALVSISDMASEILGVAERLIAMKATNAQRQNALAGLKLLDFLQGERDYTNTVARAERVARSLQITTSAVRVQRAI